MARNEGFTLLELIVVMAIIGVMGTLGIYSMVTFQRSITVQQATDEVVTIAKDTRSMAKNNVLPYAFPYGDTPDKFTYAYQLSFQPNQLTRTLCARPIVGPQTTWTCFPTTDEQLKTKSIFNDVVFQTSPTIVPVLGNVQGCKSILFENLTGDMKVNTNSMASPNYSDSYCEMKVSPSTFPSYYRRVGFDGRTDTFNIINE